MGRIGILPPAVADRIAAGEVVDRPASVVRELIDNAIDSGATRVDVELIRGGSGSIAVTDNGHGMQRDDAILAFERHATSKIQSGDDLDAITTLGFRGEALAAISAVARVELLTASGAGEGTKVAVEKGRLITEEAAPRSRGTSVTVTRLFEGVPARKKFLRSEATELDYSNRVVQRAALARASIAFRLTHGERTLLNTGPAANRFDRVRTVLGPRWGKDLIRAEGEIGESSLEAFVAPPFVSRPTRDGIHLFVNDRPVRDPFLLRAVIDAHRGRFGAGRFPIATLFLRLPADSFDVNVHPAKSELRFHSPREVRSLVVRSLERSLASSAAIGTMTRTRVAELPPPHLAVEGRDRSSVLDSAGALSESGSRAAELPTRRVGEGVIALAQYAHCFIVAHDDSGLMIVDQHTAHERVLFERLIRDAASGPLPRQTLLFPKPIDLNERQIELAADAAGTMRKLGFVYEAYGRGALLVREVPAVYGHRGSSESILDLLARLERGEEPGADDLDRKLLATIACHSAVRKGMELSREKMGYIVGALKECDTPTHCPHGRATTLRIDLAELEREFGRR